MEALYFFKFWKPNPSQKPEDLQPFSSTGPSTTMSSSMNIKQGGGRDQLEEEGDDSFFELELIPTTSSRAIPSQSYSYRFEPSSDSSISKRKVLPIEPRTSKPLLKSAPSLKVLTFNKSKSPARRDSLGNEQGGGSSETRSFVPILGRDNSLRRYIREEDRFTTSNNEDEGEEWKIGKYLKLIYRPLYNARKGKKVTELRGIMGSSPSPSCSPLTVDSSPRKEWKVSKKLGKSKSSSVVAERRDDSLALHHDGIQGAILHCKKSFNSSRDPSLLSRLACEEYSQFRESPRSSSDAS